MLLSGEDEGIELGIQDGGIGRIVHPDFGDITEEVALELSRMHGMSAGGREMSERAAVRQRELAVAAKFLGVDGSKHLMGNQRVRVTSEVYHYWGQRLGYECWTEREFVDGYMRKHFEEVRA